MDNIIKSVIIFKPKVTKKWVDIKSDINPFTLMSLSLLEPRNNNTISHDLITDP